MRVEGRRLVMQERERDHDLGVSGGGLVSLTTAEWDYGKEDGE
jgi:hypothetical protein